MLRQLIVTRPKVFYGRLGMAIGATIICGIIYKKFYCFDREIVVKDKYTKHDQEKTYYMITDYDNNIYKFDKHRWRLHWLSERKLKDKIFERNAELWTTIEKDKKYNVRGNGVRNSFFGWYPSIYKANEIDE